MDQGGNGSDEGHDIPDGLELHNSLLMHNLLGTQHGIRGSNYPSEHRYYECS